MKKRTKILGILVVVLFISCIVVYQAIEKPKEKEEVESVVVKTETTGEIAKDEAKLSLIIQGDVIQGDVYNQKFRTTKTQTPAKKQEIVQKPIPAKIAKSEVEKREKVEEFKTARVEIVVKDERKAVELQEYEPEEEWYEEEPYYEPEAVYRDYWPYFSPYVRIWSWYVWPWIPVGGIWLGIDWYDWYYGYHYPSYYARYSSGYYQPRNYRGQTTIHKSQLQAPKSVNVNQLQKSSKSFSTSFKTYPSRISTGKRTGIDPIYTLPRSQRPQIKKTYSPTTSRSISSSRYIGSRSSSRSSSRIISRGSSRSISSRSISRAPSRSSRSTTIRSTSRSGRVRKK